MTQLTKKVLIVDDEPSFREPISDMLEDEYFTVNTAESGIGALDIMKYNLPDLVITDIKMPKMDGVALLKELHSNYPDVSVIMMSAFGTIDSAVEAMKKGAVDYITKPLNLDTVLIRVNSVFEKRELKKKLEEMELYAAIAQNIKTLGRVGANNAHKFNNLLTTPMFNCTMWEKLINALPKYIENPNDPDVKKVFSFFINEGASIIEEEKMIFKEMRDILKMWWRLSADKPDKKPYSVDLIKCLDNAQKMIHHELSSGNTIILDYDKNAKYVIGTYNDITRLFINLLLNTADAISAVKKVDRDHGGVINITTCQNDKSIQITIKDNGIGLTKDVLFNINKQLTSAARVFSISQGGLYDCYGILSKLSGSVSVKSDGIGKGTSFCVTLPCSP